MIFIWSLPEVDRQQSAGSVR